MAIVILIRKISDEGAARSGCKRGEIIYLHIESSVRLFEISFAS